MSWGLELAALNRENEEYGRKVARGYPRPAASIPLALIATFALLLFGDGGVGRA